METEKPTLTIEGDRVALGPLQRALVPLYARWINDLASVRTLGRIGHPTTLEEQQRWYDTMTSSETDHCFTVYDRAGWRPIGNAGLHQVDLGMQRASFGISLFEASARGKGLGTETTRLVLDFGFTVLGLRNVMLLVYEFNRAGLRCYEKAGFKEIGRRRSCQRLGDTWYDDVYMDCLASEFQSPVLGKLYRPDRER